MIEEKLSSLGYRKAPKEMYDMVFKKKRNKEILLSHIVWALFSIVFCVSLILFKDVLPYVINIIEVIFSIFKWKVFILFLLMILSLIPWWASIEGVIVYYALRK